MTGRPPLVAVVGRYGRKDGETAFGFAGLGGGGLTGIFSGGADVAATDGDRAVVVAGGGSSAVRDLCDPGARGGPGNHADGGGMAGMRGGEATYTAPDGRNANTGGRGGYRAGRGREAAGQAGLGGTGYVADAAPGL